MSKSRLCSELISRESINPFTAFSACGGNIRGYLLGGRQQSPLLDTSQQLRVTITYTRSDVPTNYVDRSGNYFARVMFDGTNTQRLVCSTCFPSLKSHILRHCTQADPITGECGVFVHIHDIDWIRVSNSAMVEDMTRKSSEWQAAVSKLAQLGVPLSALSVYGGMQAEIYNTAVLDSTRDIDIAVSGFSYAAAVAELAQAQDQELHPEQRLCDSKGDWRRLVRHSLTRIYLSSGKYIDIKVIPVKTDEHMHPYGDDIASSKDQSTGAQLTFSFIGEVTMNKNTVGNALTLPASYLVETKSEIIKVLTTTYDSIAIARPGDIVYVSGITKQSISSTPVTRDGSCTSVLYLQTSKGHIFRNYSAEQDMLELIHSYS